LDADGDPDLLLALEWEPLTLYINVQGRFRKKVPDTPAGLWNFALPHDFDGDGDADILAGNLGANSRFQPSAKQPLRLYVNDFDQNRQPEPVLTYYLAGREIPFAPYPDLMKQMPSLKKRFLFAKDFAAASVEEIFDKEKIARSVRREVTELRSVFFENKGNLAFEAHPLPAVLQFSTLNAAALADLDGDNRPEVLLGGNFFDCQPELGRFDANFGNVLKIGKGGAMEVFPLGNLRLDGQVQRIGAVNAGGRVYVVFAKNNGKAAVVSAGNRKG
jgi:hypothetical protein